jgi:hypothetical protein
VPIILLFLALFLLSCDGNNCDDVVGPETGPTVGMDTSYGQSYAERRRKWDSARIDCYELDIIYVYGMLTDGPLSIKVEHDTIVSVVNIDLGFAYNPSTWHDFPTVDSLFDRIKRIRNNKGWTSTFGRMYYKIEDEVYDQRYGIPLSFDAYVTGDSVMVMDSGESFVVTRFTPLRCQ